MLTFIKTYPLESFLIAGYLLAVLAGLVTIIVLAVKSNRRRVDPWEQYMEDFDKTGRS